MIVIVPGGKQSQILLRRLRTKSYFVGFAKQLFSRNDYENELFSYPQPAQVILDTYDQTLLCQWFVD